MWEISIISPSKHKKHLESIENDLLSKFKSANLFIAFSKFGTNNHVLSIAAKSEIENIKKFIRKTLTENLILMEKEDILKKEVNIEFLSESSKFALIKALVLFDFDEDKVIVEKKLNLEKNIVTHAFFNFKLKALKQKWSELAKISSQEFFANSEIFFEFLKFLVESIQPKDLNVIISQNNNSFLIKDTNNKLVKEEKINGRCNDEVELITKLIMLSPQKIKFHNNISLSQESFKLIRYIFEQKISDN